MSQLFSGYAKEIQRLISTQKPTGKLLFQADGSNFPFTTNIAREREGGVYLDATVPYMNKPSFAIDMKTTITLMECYIDLTLWTLANKLGLEILWKSSAYTVIGIELRNSPDLDQYAIQFADDLLQIRNGSSSFTTLDAVGNASNPDWKNTKLIADLSQKKYVKLYHGEKVYDLTGKTPYVSSTADRKRIRFFIYTTQATKLNFALFIATEES